MESKEGVKLTWEVKYASHVDSYSSLVLGTEKLVEIKNNPQMDHLSTRRPPCLSSGGI